ncbi:unnamed protein product [Blepharisma stoltei]|uniref:Uncharacterized protein n=1 Tax=Blepharisma stoltei TaxID=1481888 RepID=A0AAU9IDD7_9CILI|nr:unnamed protein product [Blepharisma stoltei]
MDAFKFRKKKLTPLPWASLNEELWEKVDFITKVNLKIFDDKVKSKHERDINYITPLFQGNIHLNFLFYTLFNS